MELDPDWRREARRPRPFYVDLTAVASLAIVVFTGWYLLNTPDDLEQKRRELAESERADNARREDERQARREQELQRRREDNERFERQREELRLAREKAKADYSVDRDTMKQKAEIEFERVYRKTLAETEAEALKREREGTRLSLHVLDQNIQSRVISGVDPDHIARLQYERKQAALEASHRECMLLVRYLEENDTRIDDLKARLLKLLAGNAAIGGMLKESLGLKNATTAAEYTDTMLQKISALPEPPRALVAVSESLAHCFAQREKLQTELAAVQREWYAAREKLNTEKKPTQTVVSESTTIKLTTYTLKNGRRIIGVQSVDAGDEISVKSISGRFYKIRKDAIERID